MNQSQIVQRVWELLEPELAEQGFELVEVQFGQDGATEVLRLFVDREGGVTMDQVVEATRLVNPVLDMGDFIESAYNLEVSSPGIDRPIRKQADFERFCGEDVKVKTVSPIGGRRRFHGTLVEIKDGLVAVECDGTTHQIHIENVLKANLDR